MAESDLRQIADLFTRHGVEFIVIGGQAEALMGGSRVTYNVDFCYRRTQENLQRLAEALKDLNVRLRGAPADLQVVIDLHALSLGNNYTFETRLGSLDLLGWVEPLGDFESLAKNAQTVPVGNLRLNVIGLDDLIRIKEHLDRAKDRESLSQLKAIRRIRNESSGPQDG
jgi:uncharacterized protein (DUF1330 family)